MTSTQVRSITMCCMTYFDTITHPYQNLRTPSDFYAPQEKVYVSLYFLHMLQGSLQLNYTLKQSNTLRMC